MNLQTVRPNKAMDQINGLPFSESPSSTRTPTTRSPIHCLGHLGSHDVCVSIGLIFLSFNLCHSTHICSYLNLILLSVRPTFTPSLIHPYLIYGVLILSWLRLRLDQIIFAIRLDYLAPQLYITSSSLGNVPRQSYAHDPNLVVYKMCRQRLGDSSALISQVISSSLLLCRPWL